MNTFPFVILFVLCTSSFAENIALKNDSMSPLNTNIKTLKEIPTAKTKTNDFSTIAVENRKLASITQHEFIQKINNHWRVPLDSQGQTATARVILSNSGSVISISVNASDPNVKASVEEAIRNAAPFPMPSDPEIRKLARRLFAEFTVE